MGPDCFPPYHRDGNRAAEGLLFENRRFYYPLFGRFVGKYDEIRLVGVWSDFPLPNVAQDLIPLPNGN